RKSSPDDCRHGERQEGRIMAAWRWRGGGDHGRYSGGRMGRGDQRLAGALAGHQMSARAFLVLLLCAGLICLGMAMVTHARAAECGEASWYSQGRVTASGERYNPDGISAAHPSLPFGSRVVVRDMASGRSVTVRISDRGP